MSPKSRLRAFSVTVREFCCIDCRLSSSSSGNCSEYNQFICWNHMLLFHSSVFAKRNKLTQISMLVWLSHFWKIMPCSCGSQTVGHKTTAGGARRGGGGGWYETNFIVEFADTIVQCFIKLKFKLDHFLFLKVWGVECDSPPPSFWRGHIKKKVGQPLPCWNTAQRQ